MQISILGCGWLGLPLAEAMIQKGFTVKGSTTSPDKVAVLQASGIDSYLISVNLQGIQGDINSFLDGSEVLIIDIPPKLRATQSESFIKKMKNLIPYIESASISKIIFVSSTSVYGDDDEIVTEDTPPNPATEAGLQLLATETLLQKNQHFQTTVIRFGGLIGGERHPVKYMAGKTGLDNPDAPVNLIHRDDCIGIILKIIEKEAWGKVFNGVAPYHPTRKEYYTQIALETGLIKPNFRLNSSPGKKVQPFNTTNYLLYNFINLYLRLK